jgi:hypothetical protein
VITFENLSEQILSRSLVRTFGNAEAWDAALDARDSDPQFESAWLAAHEAVGRAASESDHGRARELARKAFLPVSEHTRQHEIASYVADDIELLALGSLTQASNEFLEQLYSAYVRVGFAVPPLP